MLPWLLCIQSIFNMNIVSALISTNYIDLDIAIQIAIDIAIKNVFHVT